MVDFSRERAQASRKHIWGNFMTEETTPVTSGSPDTEPAAEDAAALPYASESTPVTGGDSHAPITRGDVAVLAVRLLGVIAIIQGSAFLAVLGSVFSNFGAGAGVVWATLAVAAPYGIYLGAGIVLVATAGWIGPKLLPDARRSDDAAGRASARDIQAVAFSVIGVAVAVWSVGELASAIWYLSFRSARRDEDHTAWDLASPHLVRFAIQVGVGVVLFLGAKGLSRVWHRVREPNPLGGAVAEADPGDPPEPREGARPERSPDEQPDHA
jgi:hypothetical protein